MNPARKKIIGRLIKFAKARIKNIDLKENEQPETPTEYLGNRLFLMMGQDEFYSGKKPSAAYP